MTTVKKPSKDGKRKPQKKLGALPVRALLFVKEYLIDLNGAQAAIRAGYSEKCAKEQAARLLTNANVKELVEAGMAERAKRTEITADMVLAHWWKIATADPRKLVEYIRDSCRYCYGVDNQYHWSSVAEFVAAVTKFNDDNTGHRSGAQPPNDVGGYGFNPARPASLDCKSCHGRGVGHVHAKDTREFDDEATALFAGAKEGAQGFEIKMRDQDKAMENIARHLGMFTEKLELTGRNGAPLQSISTVTRDPIEAAKIYQQLMGGGGKK